MAVNKPLDRYLPGQATGKPMNKSAATTDAPGVLRLELVRIFMQIPNFVEMTLQKQEDILEFYYNYVVSGKSEE